VVDDMTRITDNGSLMTTSRAWAMLLTAMLLALLMHAGTARAAGFGIEPGSFTADALRADGVTPETQAGAHPYRATTNFAIRLREDGSGHISEYMRDLRLDLPSGFVANPEAAPKCPRADFDGMVAGSNTCPAASQVGAANITTRLAGTEALQRAAVYNIEPKPGDTADIGMVVASVPVHIVARVDPARGYAVRVESKKTSQGLPVSASLVTLWGVPADESHDAERACGVAKIPDPPVFFPCTSRGTRSAFVTNPAECGVESPATLTLNSWDHPDVFDTASYTPPTLTGCDRLEFDPTVDAASTTSRPDAPTGLKVDLDIPQNADPDGLATPPLRDASVTLPEGLTVNPASADGLGACTDSQLGLKTDSPVTCPEAAKIGTVTAISPLLADPLEGSVYLRTQNSDDPASGEMFRMAIVLENQERGLLIKLPGQVKVDPSSGRIVTQFADNPQMPVSKISLVLKSGARAPLATPAICGTKTIEADLSSWGGQSTHSTSAFTVDCTPGLGGFAPSFTAGTSRPIGGAFSPFALQISKPDGNAAVNGLSMVMPAGLLAKLKGNLGTQVGSVKAFAGPGSNPFMLPGQVFLEGRYGDAPFSLRVVVPAKAGPFDLGVVTVRQKIYVDPITAQVTVVSDPVPTIVKGVPVRLQRLEVNVDKPDFMINPTSCAAKTISGTLSALGGQTAAVSNRFHVSACKELELKPELGLTLSGKGQTTDGKHPAITASLTQKPGQSNLEKVRVALPLSLALDPDNANGLCEFVDGSKVEPTCPKASIVGSVTATTPILDEPLSGPVYFVKNVRKDPKSGRDIRTLPKLVIPLVGQNGVRLTLTGTSDVVDDQLVTTFDNIPDAPVSSFTLNINGGKGGILVVSGADICKATQIAEQQVDGQNTKTADTDVYIQTPSCPTKILSKKVGKTTVRLKIGGLGAGKVTITGKGIRKTTKTITKSTVATITAKRTKGTPGKVTVSYDPTGPAKAHKTTK
jgi:hypothetical protein